MNQPSRTADLSDRNGGGGAAELLEQLDAVLDELTALAQTTPDRETFYALLLNRLLVATHAEAVAVWIPGPEGALLPAYARQLEQAFAGASSDARARELDQLQAFAEGKQPHSLLRGARGGLVAAFELRIVDRTPGILTIHRVPGEAPAVSEGLMPLAQAMVEILIDYEKNRLLQQVENQLETQRSLSAVVADLHSCRTSTALAYVVANDGRTFLECDRVSVLRIGGRARHIATSSVARVDRRSKYSRRLSDLATKLARRGKPVAYPQGHTELPGRLHQDVERFAAEHGLTSFYLIFWKSSPGGWSRPRATGAYTVEFLQATDIASRLQRLGMLERHLAVAWDNLARQERNPLRGVGLFLGWATSQLGLDRLPRTVVALLVLSGILAALLGIQREFRIEVQGELVPVARPHVWAPLDGIVRNVTVEHGSQVQVGQVLAELETPELDLELQKVVGKLRAARLRREGYRLSLQQAELQREEPSADPLKLSAEIAEIDAEIENLDGERQYLEGQREQRVIVSPISGQVVTWNVTELLANRPVRQGESLMIVGDTGGAWQVEFAVPDRLMKYLGEAQQQHGEHLVIDCLIAGETQHAFTAQLERVAQIATPGVGTEPELKVIASLDRADVSEPRVGLSVTGRVRCGRRSLWYIGTYEAMDAVRRRFFW